MTKHTPQGKPQDSLNQARRIDIICDQFEQEWIAGRQPKIEEHLHDTQGPNHTTLLRELVALDLEYRRKRGENADVSDYMERFPGLSDVSLDLSDTMSRTELDRNDLRALFALLSPPEEADELGRLGSYRILDVLGIGGMGAVFKAEDLQLQRPVALKVIQPTQLHDESARRRFLREARSAAAIQDDHVIRIYQVGEDSGVPFLAMELLQGESLKTRLLSTNSLPVDEVLRIAKEAAKGLAAAHSKGLLHRDIKPDNMWLEAPNDRVKLLDFGLARATESDGDLTEPNMILGTPAYMSPEQAYGQQYDHRCDLYSLGVVLYQAATGRHPISGDTPIAILAALKTATVEPVSKVKPNFPATVSNLITNLLEKDPERRLQSAEELIAEIEKIEPTFVARSIPETPSYLKTEILADTIKCTKPPWTSHRKSAITVALFGLVCLLGITIYLVRTDKGELTIKTDNPDVVVTIKQGDVTVVDTSTKRTFELKSGDYDVEVREVRDGIADKVAMRTQHLKLRRDDKAIFEVSFASRTPSAADEGSTPTPPPLAVAPFDATQAKIYQERWAKHLGVPVERDFDLPGGTKITFVLIPPGKFLMGATEAQFKYDSAQAKAKNDKVWLNKWLPLQVPQHRVRITKPFYLAKYEMTQAQWQAITGNNPSESIGPNLPVTNVNWNDCQSMLEALNELKHIGIQFKLPTEAQWEHACRAGTITGWYCGDDEKQLVDFAWYAPNADERLRPVGRLNCNAWGIHDMHGNVWEWCADIFHPTYYSKSPLKDPLGSPSGDRPMIRGGGRGTAYNCRSAARHHLDPNYTDRSQGVRLAGELIHGADNQFQHVADDNAREPGNLSDRDGRTLFTGAFDSDNYGDGVLNGQDGWEGSVVLSSNDKHLPGRVMDGFQPNGKPIGGYRKFELPKDASRIVLKCDVFASSGVDGTYISHNSAVGFGRSRRIRWACIGQKKPVGWSFDAHKAAGDPNAHERVHHGFDRPVTLYVIVDRNALQVYGRLDDGESVHETQHFPITEAVANELDRVVIEQDLREGSGGIKVGNLSVVSYAGSKEPKVTKAPKTAIAPFNAEQAKDYQEQWAKYLGVPVDYTNPIGMKFRLIPPGEFWMVPNPNGGLAKMSPHIVKIKKAFYLGVHEVTIGQFHEFVNETAHVTQGERKGGASVYVREEGLIVHRKSHEYSWKNAGLISAGHFPVGHLSGKDALAFCSWLSKKQPYTARLPMEMEWEFACRAGTTTKFFFGNDVNSFPTYGNVADLSLAANPNLITSLFVFVQKYDGFALPAPVGQFKPNAFGLYDMLGNHAEICGDVYDGNGKTSLINSHILGHLSVRGGCSNNRKPYEVESNWRVVYPADSPGTQIGFRVACDCTQALIDSDNNSKKGKLIRESTTQP